MTESDWRPSHAYVPGQNKRHPEGLFDFLKQGIDQCTLSDLPATAAWRYAIEFYDHGFFWESHELFEAIWMACPPNSAEKIFVQAKIQQANAALKERMGLERAALRIAAEADALMEESRRRSGGSLFGGMLKI